MDLKFYLNKFAKVDNIEGYSLKTLKKLTEKYQSFLNDSDGGDPDFPMYSFGGGGKKVNGTNSFSNDNGLDEDMESQDLF